LPSTYISASVEKYPGEVSIGVEATIIPQDKRALLKRTLPPFSSTRVVENSLSPYWNEMLLVTIPHSWNNDKEESFLAIKIELIRREKCQQEDYVLGYAMIPSPSLHFECHEKRIKLHFSTGTTDKAPVTLFLSYSICRYVK
jgi:Ca2+-dependent lipid-binding protein